LKKIGKDVEIGKWNNRGESTRRAREVEEINP